MTAASVNFNSTGYALATSNGYALTLTAGSSGSGVGITTYVDAATNKPSSATINTPVVIGNLGGTQTWSITTGGQLALGNTVAQGSGTTSGAVLVINGGGTLNYSGTSFAPNRLVVTGGSTMTSSGTANLPAITGGTNIGSLDNGTLNVTGGTFTVNNTLNVGSGGPKTGGGTVSGLINVSGGTLATTSDIDIGDGSNQTNDIGVLTITGGMMSTGSAASVMRLGNTASGSGTLNLNGGTLSTNAVIARGAATPMGSSNTTKASAFNFNGGTLQASGSFLTIDATVTTNVGDGGALIDTSGFNVALSTSLQKVGVGGLTKNGGGTLTLTGVNTYAGATFLNGGTLVADSADTVAGATGLGKVTVNSGATLAGGSAGGTGHVKGAVAVTAGGTVTAGSGATPADSVGTLATGDQAWAAGGTDVIKFANTTSVAGTGWDDLTMGVLDLSDLGSGRTFTLSVVNRTLAANPFSTTKASTYTIASATAVKVGGAVLGTADTELGNLFTLKVDGVSYPAADFRVVAKGSGSARDIVLDFDPTPTGTPEPASILLAATAGVTTLARRRRPPHAGARGRGRGRS